MGNFGRGAAAAEQAVKDNRPAQFERNEFFKIEEDGGEAIIRLVHDGDEWYHVKHHGFVPTRPADPSWDEEKTKKYPTRMGATCRRDKAFDYGECYICDHLHERVKNDKTKNGKYYPTIRYYVPAVMREAVLGTQEMIDAGEIPATVRVRGEEVSTIDRVIGYKDQMVEYQPVDADGNPDGPVKTKPRVVIINLAHDNFFVHLQGFYEVPNDEEECTVLDRDFRVRREGLKTETKYKIRPLKPVKGHDLRDPATRAKYDTIDIEKIMTDLASDEYYDQFFDDRHPRPTRDSDSKDGEKNGAKKTPVTKTAPAAQQTKPAETAVEDDDDADGAPAAAPAASLADIKARMTKSHAKPAAKKAPAPVEDDEDVAPTSSQSDADEDEDSLVGAV